MNETQQLLFLIIIIINKKKYFLTAAAGGGKEIIFSAAALCWRETAIDMYGTGTGTQERTNKKGVRLAQLSKIDRI